MTTRFEERQTSLKGLKVLRRKPLGDNRGFLERLFCSEDLQVLLKGKEIHQINHTATTNSGVVRGMHFQYPPFAETKFVMCIKGKVLDVVVDLRCGSASFLKWHGEILSSENYKTLVIPEGFAHGFQTLTNDCEMLYFHTAAYQAESEGGINAQDPRLGVRWPLPISEQSERDMKHSMIKPGFKGIVV